MPTYTYKGLDISYDIVYSDKFNSYEANGHIKLQEKGQLTYTKEFRTEVSTKKDAIKEIKNLMQEFIDFEWHQSQLVHENSMSEKNT